MKPNITSPFIIHLNVIKFFNFEINYKRNELMLQEYFVVTFLEGSKLLIDGWLGLD